MRDLISGASWTRKSDAGVGDEASNAVKIEAWVDVNDLSCANTDVNGSGSDEIRAIIAVTESAKSATYSSSLKRQM